MGIRYSGGIVATGGIKTEFVSIPSAAVENPSSWDPLDKSANITLSNNNLTAVGSTTWSSFQALGAQSTGKYYFEFSNITGISAYHVIGVGRDNMSNSTFLGDGSGGGNARGFYSNGQTLSAVEARVSYGPAWFEGEGVSVVSMAVNLDIGSVWFATDGVWGAGATISDVENGINAAHTGLSGSYKASGSLFSSGNPSFTANFGGSAFAQTVPAGFSEGWPAT